MRKIYVLIIVLGILPKHKKGLFIWSVISAVLMLVLPLLIVLFAADAGMMLCFLLFYAVNPIYSILIGCVAGKDIRTLWPLPITSSVLFLAGAWLLLDIEEMLFAVYAAIYMGLGISAMFISKFISKKFSKRPD